MLTYTCMGEDLFMSAVRKSRIALVSSVAINTLPKCNFTITGSPVLDK